MCSTTQLLVRRSCEQAIALATDTSDLWDFATHSRPGLTIGKQHLNWVAAMTDGRNALTFQGLYARDRGFSCPAVRLLFGSLSAPESSWPGLATERVKGPTQTPP